MVKIVVSISQYILVLRRFVKIKRFIFHSTYCRFVVDFFNSGNTYMNTLTLICMTFSPTSTHYQPTPTHSHSLSIHSHPLPFMFSTLLLILNPPPPLPLNLSPDPNTLTYSNPSSAIPTHIQSLCFTCLHVLHTCALICFCGSRTNAPMQSISMNFTAYVYMLYMPFFVLIRQDCLFTLRFFKTCLQYQCSFLSVYFPPMVFLPWFSC